VTQEFIRREGRPPKGWMGPAASESNVTPDLLKEAGYQYVMDWPADDQPFWLKTRAGPLLSIPYPAELNDSAAIIRRDGTARDFGDMIVDGFDEMVEQCEKQSLVMTISLHPFVMGQPFRLPPLRKALKHCAEHRRRKRCGGRRRARSPMRATGCHRGPSRAKARKFDAAVSGPARSKGARRFRVRRWTRSIARILRRISYVTWVTVGRVFWCDPALTLEPSRGPRP
jgi:hypothetical protein